MFEVFVRQTESEKGKTLDRPSEENDYGYIVDSWTGFRDCSLASRLREIFQTPVILIVVVNWAQNQHIKNQCPVWQSQIDQFPNWSNESLDKLCGLHIISNALEKQRSSESRSWQLNRTKLVEKTISVSRRWGSRCWKNIGFSSVQGLDKGRQDR